MPEKKYIVTMTEVEEKQEGPPAKSAEKWFLLALLAVGIGGSFLNAIGK